MHYKVMLWRNWKYSRKMWTLASANLTRDVNKAGLHHRHINTECSEFLFFFGRWGKLYHKTTLITCKSAYLFICLVSQIKHLLLIALRRSKPRNRNFRQKLLWKKAVLKNLTNFPEKILWWSSFLNTCSLYFFKKNNANVF